MISFAIATLVSLFSGQPTSPAVLQQATCDRECAAVLEATLAWLKEEIERYNRSTRDPALFLFVDPLSPSEGKLAGAAGEEALRAAAERSGLPVAGRKEYLGKVVCRESPDVEACRPFAGMSYLEVKSLEKISSEAFRVTAGFSVIRSSAELPGPGAAVLRGAVLRLEKRQGKWTVVAKELTIVS